MMNTNTCELRATVRIEKNGNMIVDIPELASTMKVTPSYYKKHMTRMENDRAKIQEMLLPTAVTGQEQSPPAPT